MLLLKIPLTEPNPPPRIGAQFFFKMLTTKVVSASCAVRKLSPDIPEAAATFSPKYFDHLIDEKFTGLAAERNWCTNMLRCTKQADTLVLQGGQKPIK
jgi:hypothetical protein